MPTATTSDTHPALLGGSPAVTADQTRANRWPIVTEEDEQAVLNVLRSGELSIHQEVANLEADFCQRIGVKHAVAHCNGTSAILAALHGFGMGSGDEVIVPSATWWASVLPVVHCGATPVFVETEQDCLGLDPADVEAKITERTKAIIVVHLFGIPSKMDELLSIARKHNLKLLEDASHAHGATYHDRPIGCLGDAAVFSMQTNKLVPAGEGGMFLTDDSDLYEKVIRFGHYERLLGLNSPNKRFAATGFGFKFRMSPMNAALARVQLKHLDERNAQRNSNCIYLSEKLEKLGFQTFLSPPNVSRVYFEFLIGYDASQTNLPIRDLARALQAEGAQVGAPRYPLVHQQPFFTEGHWANIARIHETNEQPIPKYDPAALPRTLAGNGSLLKLPSFPQASRELLDQYVLAFEKVIHHAQELPQAQS